MELKSRNLFNFFLPVILSDILYSIFTLTSDLLQDPLKTVRTRDKVIVHNVCLSQCAVSNKTYHLNSLIRGCSVFLC